MDFSQIFAMLGGGGGGQMQPLLGQAQPLASLSGGPSLQQLSDGMPTMAPQGQGFMSKMGGALNNASGGGEPRFLNGLSAANAQQVGLGHMLRMLMPDLFSNMGQQ